MCTIAISESCGWAKWHASDDMVNRQVDVQIVIPKFVLRLKSKSRWYCQYMDLQHLSLVNYFSRYGISWLSK